MADLSRRGRRGQILLITAFVLAVIFVGLALVMNTVIYSENLATRADSTTSQPVLHANSMETGTEALIEYINEHNTSSGTTFADLEGELADGLGNVSEVSGRHSLRDGQVTDATLGSAFEGAVIEQTDVSRNFTNVSTATSWTPVDGANGATDLEIFVTNAGVSSGSSAFTFQAQDTAGATWTMHVGDSNVSGTDSQGTSFGCSPSTTTDFWVNVSDGTVDGADCDGLHFADHLDTVDRIDFDDTQRINGTYSFVVNKTAGSIDGSDYSSSGSNPVKLAGIYGTWVDIDFERQTLVFETERRAVPGRDDD